jgi:hypothetical protein
MGGVDRCSDEQTGGTVKIGYTSRVAQVARERQSLLFYEPGPSFRLTGRQNGMGHPRSNCCDWLAMSGLLPVIKGRNIIATSRRGASALQKKEASGLLGQLHRC